MMTRFPFSRKTLSLGLMLAVLGCGDDKPADSDASKDAANSAADAPAKTGKAKRQTSLGDSPSTQRVD